MRKIEWTPDGSDSLNEIIEYYAYKAGEEVALNIFNKINKKVEILSVEEMKTRIVPNLKDLGIYDIYQLVIDPWIVYYRISGDNKKVKILFVLDGRRDIKTILTQKVIDNKL